MLVYNIPEPACSATSLRAFQVNRRGKAVRVQRVLCNAAQILARPLSVADEHDSITAGRKAGSGFERAVMVSAVRHEKPPAENARAVLFTGR
jgi:hypothetical protein